jgi:cytochrome c oxidase subunit 3
MPLRPTQSSLKEVRSMPGNTVIEDIELIIDDLRGGGGKLPPPSDPGDGGDGSKFRSGPPPRRYSIAIGLAMVSILVLFLTIVVAFVVLEHFNTGWTPAPVPRILWANTVVLLASSITLQLARRSVAAANLRKFQIFWRLTTALGVLFLGGQVIAWLELVHAGLFISSQASSFFYVFTGVHGVHLAGGIAALLYVSFRKFERANSRAAASQVASYYWHFMDGLWILLFALLCLGR